jgi:hypothetical protein
MLTRWKQEFLEYSKGAIKRGMTEPEKELRAEKELYQELESQYLLKVNTGKMSPDVIEISSFEVNPGRLVLRAGYPVLPSCGILGLLQLF